MSLSRTIEGRTQLATELSGAFTVASLGLHAGIPGSADLASQVCHMFARLGLSPLSVPDNLRGVMGAGAASAVSRGLTEYARRAALRIEKRPLAWPTAGGVVLGAIEMPYGTSVEDEDEIRSIRALENDIADEITALGPEGVREAAVSLSSSRSLSTTGPGAVVAAAAVAGAIWMVSRGR